MWGEHLRVIMAQVLCRQTPEKCSKRMKKKKEQHGSVHHQTRHGFAWASQVRGLLVHGPTQVKTLHTKLRLWSWHLLSVVRGAGIYENQTHSILGGLWLQNSLLFASKCTTVLRSYFAPQVTNFKMLARNYKWWKELCFRMRISKEARGSVSALS